MDVGHAVNFACRGLDVGPRPHMAQDSLKTCHDQEGAERPFHSPEVLAQALRVYTGGGPALQARLCAQGIKYLQQFRHPAFGKYSSEGHLEKEDTHSNNNHPLFASSLEMNGNLVYDLLNADWDWTIMWTEYCQDSSELKLKSHQNCPDKHYHGNDSFPLLFI